MNCNKTNCMECKFGGQSDGCHFDDESYNQALEDCKELIKAKLIDNLGLEDATKYGSKNAKQQTNSYATVMKYEIADCIDDLLDDLEQLIK